MDEKHVKSILESQNPPLSPSTIYKYLGILRKLSPIKKYKSLEFLNETEQILEKIQIIGNRPAEDETIKGKLTAILTVIRIFKLGDDLYAKYRPHHESISKKLKLITLSGVKNQKQKDYYMTAEEIEEIGNNLKHKAFSENSTFTDRQKCFLWALYTKITPRRNLDYWLMDVIDYEIDTDCLPTDTNYLILLQRKFVYYQHKNTKHTEKRKVVETIEFSDNYEFIEILDNYLNGLKHHTPRTPYPLLQYKNGARYETTNFILSTLTKIAGKKFGSNALRHIIAENNAPPRSVLDSLRKTAQQQGHDLITHIDIYIKHTH